MNINDPTVQLFHTPFNVSLPSIYMYSTDEIEMFGTPTSGNKGIDEMMMNAPVYTYMTIPQMAEKYDEGAPISLVNPKDSVKIAELISEHLNRWLWILKNTVNGKAPPEEDFVVLDQLAMAIHPYAISYNDGEVPQTGLRRMLGRMQKSTALVLKPSQRKARTKPTKRKNMYLDDLSAPTSEEVRQGMDDQPLLNGYHSPLAEILRYYR